ncbi:MAG: hypothetical protein R3C53_19165 [Pirellulaceae bacterium]
MRRLAAIGQAVALVSTTVALIAEANGGGAPQAKLNRSEVAVRRGRRKPFGDRFGVNLLKEVPSVGYVAEGKDEELEFASLTGMPDSILDRGHYKLVVSRQLKELGVEPKLAAKQTDLVSESIPEIVQQVEDRTALMELRILRSGSFAARSRWKQSDLEFTPCSAKHFEIARGGKAPIEVGLPDGDEVQLNRRYLRAFPQESLVGVVTSGYLSGLEQLNQVMVASIYCQSANENHSEAVRFHGDDIPRRLRLPVVVLSAIHRRAFLARQHTLESYYVNLIAYEVCPLDGKIWSIEIAQLPLIGYLHLCGAGRGVAALANRLVENEAAQQKDSSAHRFWRGNFEGDYRRGIVAI